MILFYHDFKDIMKCFRLKITSSNNRKKLEPSENITKHFYIRITRKYSGVLSNACNCPGWKKSLSQLLIGINKYWLAKVINMKLSIKLSKVF